MITIHSVLSDGTQNRKYELRKNLLFDLSRNYWRTMKRSEIRKIFRDRIPYSYFTSYQNGDVFIEHGDIHVAQSSNILQLGCQRFVGKDLEKLRRWALQKGEKVENQEPVSEQPRTRKVRSDKGIPRGPYKPRQPKEVPAGEPVFETPAQQTEETSGA